LSAAAGDQARYRAGLFRPGEDSKKATNVRFTRALSIEMDRLARAAAQTEERGVTPRSKVYFATKPATIL